MDKTFGVESLLTSEKSDIAVKGVCGEGIDGLGVIVEGRASSVQAKLNQKTEN